MKNSFYMHLIRGLVVLMCIVAVVHCQKPEDKFPAIPFPSVSTVSADVDADGDLKILFDGKVVESDGLSSSGSIVEYGFVYSDTTASPVFGNAEKIVAEPPADGALNFTASPDPSGFNISNPYTVRAYIIMDRNPEPIYASDTRTLLFTGTLAVGMGQLRLSNDSVFAGGIIDTDLSPVGLIKEYGHLITINAQDPLGAPGSISVLLSGALPADLTFETETTVGYNNRYYIKSLVVLTNGSILYSVPAVFEVKGGFNKVANIPEKLRSGVAVSDPANDRAFAGIGRNLYIVEQNDMDLEWGDSIALPLQAEMIGTSGFVLNGNFYYTFGLRFGPNRYIDKVYMFDGSNWLAQTDLGPGDLREAAVAVTIEDTAYLGFGANFLVNGGKPSFYTYDGNQALNLICSECPPSDTDLYPYGQVAAVLDDNGTKRIYMVSGTMLGPAPTQPPGVNLTRMIIYTPAQNGNPDNWTIEEPQPYPVRRNATSFVIDNKMYVGWGNDSPNGFFNDLWVYEPGKMFERVSQPFPGVARKNPIAFVFDSVAYIGGGVGLGGQALSDMWRFTPPK